MTQQINISYSLEDILKYKNKEANNFLPPNIKPFCNEYGGMLMFRDCILKDASQVISNFLAGKNPNDIVFKNRIIELLNKINQLNYESILQELQMLNYKNQEHFTTLTQDILFRAMNDTVAVRGVDLPPDQKSLSELYADIVVAFSQLMIKDNNKEIKFIALILDLCQKYFIDFTNKIKPLDQNNQYRVDNYKGFCNFLGLLFQRKIINSTIIINCLNGMRNLIYLSSWGQLECENVYDGYKKVMYRVVNYYTNTSNTINDTDKKVLAEINKIHVDIRERNEKTSKLRKFTMMVHKDIENKLVKILG
jgi:hypothetical protein